MRATCIVAGFVLAAAGCSLLKEYDGFVDDGTSDASTSDAASSDGRSDAHVADAGDAADVAVDASCAKPCPARTMCSAGACAFTAALCNSPLLITASGVFRGSTCSDPNALTYCLSDTTDSRAAVFSFTGNAGGFTVSAQYNSTVPLRVLFVNEGTLCDPDSSCTVGTTGTSGTFTFNVPNGKRIAISAADGRCVEFVMTVTSQ